MSNRTPTRKTITAFGIFMILIVLGIYISQSYKSWIIHARLQGTLSSFTDSLYTLSYDDLRFDTSKGDIYVNNIRIVPDTNEIENISEEKLPSVLLEATIGELAVKKGKLAESPNGKDISGDTVVIHRSRIIMYILKPLQKNTRLEKEVRRVYKEILGKLSSVKIGYLEMDSLELRAVNFRSGSKSFDIFNGKIDLHDVLIDRSKNEDTLRTLFARSASFTVDSLITYDNNRPELVIKDVNYTGHNRSLVLGKIKLNRFGDSGGNPAILLDATNLRFTGTNTTAIVREKNLSVDSIGCEEIKIYEPPGQNIADLWSGRKNSIAVDTITGFQNVYGIRLKSLLFDNVKFIPSGGGKFAMGKIRFQLNNISADKISSFRKHPAHHTGDADLEIEYLRTIPGDRQYQFSLKNISVNSLSRSMAIKEAYLLPFMNESDFASHNLFQKDRYHVYMKNISLQEIEMDNIFRGVLIAQTMTVRKASVEIFRDLNRPPDTLVKIGNYPSQMIEKLDVPVSVKNVNLPMVSVEYKEKTKKNGSISAIRFENTELYISNVTNIRSEILKNNQMAVKYKSDIQGEIPLTGNLVFSLGNEKGEFHINGTIGRFKAPTLNNVSVPMASIRIKSGEVDGIHFDFRGDNFMAGGEMTMKYQKLKIDMLKKKDKYSESFRKREFLSLIANMVITDENPKEGNLRKARPRHERNSRKSFFNLIWKTLFDGIKETTGIS